jgi:hypothetical protein
MSRHCAWDPKARTPEEEEREEEEREREEEEKGEEKEESAKIPARVPFTCRARAHACMSRTPLLKSLLRYLPYVCASARARARVCVCTRAYV